MMLSVGTGAGGAGSSTMSSGGGGNVSAANAVDAVGSSNNNAYARDHQPVLDLSRMYNNTNTNTNSNTNTNTQRLFHMLLCDTTHGLIWCVWCC